MCSKPSLLLTMVFLLLSLPIPATEQLDSDSQGITVPFSWIRVVPYEASQGELRRLYDIVGGASGNIDNVVKVHSLRPHTLEGHYTLYRSVLHDPSNQLPAWLLETLGVYTSLLNHGDYSVAHHALGLRRALNEDKRTDAILEALESDQPDRAFQERNSPYSFTRDNSPSHRDISKKQILSGSGAPVRQMARSLKRIRWCPTLIMQTVCSTAWA